jgi:hypothetical protein
MENEKPQNFKFSGFQSPNYTPVPDEIFDDLIDFLSNAELKVLLYIVRRTFGFKKLSDNISFSQLCRGITTREGEILDRGTGLSKSTVALAVKSLTEKNIIVVRRNISKEKGFEPTTYALNFADAPLSENRTRVVRKIGQGLSGLSDIQETVLQDIRNNVNVGLLEQEENEDDNDDDKTDPEAYLLSEIVRHTGDTNPKSLGSFRTVIRKLKPGTAERILVATKEAYAAGKVPGNKRAGYFIGMAKNIAKERGIDLGFKNGAGRMYAGVADLKAKIGNVSAVRGMKSSRDDAE